MPTSQLRDRIAALRADAAALGRDLAAEASRLSAEELFEITGDLQGVLNATDGAQLVATAHAAGHETRLTGRGPVHVHHAPGFVDDMASSEVSLATGTGSWAAGRRVSLAATLTARFPRTLARIAAGEVPVASAAKVVTVCDGLDLAACAAVDVEIADRLPRLDPSRVTTTARRVATRIAADQLRAGHRRNRRDRFVETSPGPDGTTFWSAQLPADRSAVAWAAVRDLAGTYAEEDPSVTIDQARADALVDLLLTNVDVRAKVTIGIPVITDGEPVVEAPDESAASSASPVSGETHERPADLETSLPAIGCQGLGADFSISAALQGCSVPGIGWIDADTVEAILATVPLEVGRALLDTRTGTLLETTSAAYRPPRAMTDFVTTRDGTCRMWGCDRPAARCDVDHARPWPAGATTPANLGGLCRRHHRMKQRRRWSYRLDPDGSVTWTSPSGTQRTTLPEHAPLPPRLAPQPQPPPVPSRQRELATAGPPPF